MKHAYLTQSEIKKSLQIGAITQKEADELLYELQNCCQKNVESYGSVRVYTLI